MTQQLRTVLNGNQELQPLLSKAQALSALQSLLASVAPPHLIQSCQVLGLQLGTLSLSVANATNAAKLRQLAPELVVLLQNKGCKVSGIRVKVQVAYASVKPKPIPRKLGPLAQRALHDLSSRLNDTPLRHALEKMAKKN